MCGQPNPDSHSTMRFQIRLLMSVNLTVCLNFTSCCVLYGTLEQVSLYIFLLHKYCIKHHKNSSERAETLTDFSRGCNNYDASVVGKKS